MGVRITIWALIDGSEMPYAAQPASPFASHENPEHPYPGAPYFSSEKPLIYCLTDFKDDRIV